MHACTYFEEKNASKLIWTWPHGGGKMFINIILHFNSSSRNIEENIHIL